MTIGLAQNVVNGRPFGVGHGSYGVYFIAGLYGTRDFVDRDGIEVGRLKEVHLLSYLVYRSAGANVYAEDGDDDNPWV